MLQKLIASAPSTLIVTLPSPNVISVVLNRPKAFNALSLPQAAYLKELYANLTPDVTVIMEGADTGKKTKSFCSGGDVREIWEEGMWRWQGKAGESGREWERGGESGREWVMEITTIFTLLL